VYYRLFLFENKVRRLTERVLIESKGDDWFDGPAVPEPIRDRAKEVMEKEGAARFQSIRGANPLNYCFLPDLGKIIDENWADFEEVIYRRDWAMGKFEDLRLIRNAIAHMSDVAEDDQERLDIILRDWNRQIG
jgi:Swt1-like HEPN